MSDWASRDRIKELLEGMEHVQRILGGALASGRTLSPRESRQLAAHVKEVLDRNR